MQFEEIRFTHLAKYAKKDTSHLPAFKLAILGDWATQHLATALAGYSFLREIGLCVFDADYNQVSIQILDPTSALYAFDPDAVLIVQCVERLYEEYCATSDAQRPVFSEKVVAEIEQNWALFRQNHKAAILQANFVSIDDSVFGSFGGKTEASFAFQLQQINAALMRLASQTKGAFLVDFNAVQTQVGRAAFYSPEFYYIAKMPISADVLPLVAKRVVDVICCLRGEMIKCVVLDLDNTLWGGVIGDDGLEGIEIGELGRGHAFSDFQLWLKQLKKRGVLLAVCSKNNEDTAKEPFIKHPEMVLRLEDFAVFVANWGDKATNIRHIQQTLNIGMDSLVFLDDNPFERNLVKTLIPEITVPDLPEDPALYLSYLQRLNLFETISYSAEDGERTSQYRAEAQRQELQSQFASVGEYLQSLEMTASAAPFCAYNTPRIAQLTQRSNQFNLRTVRYTEEEIDAISKDERYISLYFTLKDRFADHGLISVVIMEKRENGILFIDTWLMSCRVLKRGMEEFIVNEIIGVAAEQGFQTVIGEYLPTKKNAMVADIYSSLGFRATGEGVFQACVSSFVPNKTYIKKENA